jgi:hypothetical protein
MISEYDRIEKQYREAMQDLGKNEKAFDRMRILIRANFVCEFCGSNRGSNSMGFWSVHHRRPRGMGGSKDPQTNSPENLLLLCGSGTTGCHGYFESHRKEAYESQIILHREQEIPFEFKDKNGVWWKLDSDYGKVRLEFQP